MFKIIDGDFKKNIYSDEAFLDNWPMLYILENGKQAYIGESNHAKTRMTQHASNEEKRIFDKVHFIYSKLFNQSVTFDYESKLIQYIVADELFQVTNKNSGIADKQYYKKEEYDEQFEKLWRKLQREKLVKHSLEEIQNSDLFKYSPYKELNDSQRTAVDDILKKLESGNIKRVVVNGMPGSGKTIVAIYLMKYLADSDLYKDKMIGFVVPQVSLRKTMKQIFKSIYGLTPSQILSPSDVTKKKYDILLVDEAHRLHQYRNISYMGPFKKNCEKLGLSTEADELDWILKQSDCAVLFYDSLQVVGPSGIDIERFDKKMDNAVPKRLISYYTLFTQMRVQGGNDYIEFVKQLLNASCEKKYHSDKYELKMYLDFSEFEKDMYFKEDQYALTRMIAGYAWPWVSQKDDSKKDISIQGVSRKWNHCTEGWVHTEEAIDEVGCIHSIQGYDLNYAFVVLGKDIGYDKDKHEIVVKSENYFDQNGKKTASYDELLNYIKNIYYVLMTRGIKGTYLFVCDDNLREYFKEYIEIAGE
ncbi:DNA/RNA helicase domain-containing protein [Pseudobutyrivibrio xylanivorans]|nr:DNA/RNA helicase domain-containing protein [Pseudobutyrivibrio xylanivorans]